MYIVKKETVTIDKVFNNTVVGRDEIEVDVKYLIENVVINATGICYASLKKVVGDSESFFDNKIIELNIKDSVIRAAYTAIAAADDFSGSELVDS